MIVTIQKRKSIFEKLENLNISFPFKNPTSTNILLRLNVMSHEYWRIYVLEIDKETVLLRRDRKQCEIQRLSFINFSRQGRFTTEGGLSGADGSISPLSKRKHHVSTANDAIQETKENPSSPSLETFRFEDENDYEYEI